MLCIYLSLVLLCNRSFDILCKVIFFNMLIRFRSFFYNSVNWQFWNVINYIGTTKHYCNKDWNFIVDLFCQNATCRTCRETLTWCDGNMPHAVLAERRQRDAMAICHMPYQQRDVNVMRWQYVTCRTSRETLTWCNGKMPHAVLRRQRDVMAICHMPYQQRDVNVMAKCHMPF